MEKQTFIIGITGGSGCGKTTLLQCIAEKGGVILDCDAIYHQLLMEDKQMLAAIEARFPGVVENGQLQRKKLGAIVFSDEKALHDLNTITHTAVKNEVLRRLPAFGLAAIDAIGLHEGDLASLCDTTVAVTAPIEDRVRRLMARDSISEEYARSRLAAQRSDAAFSAICDHTLENNADIYEFRAKCLAFLARFGIM